MDDILIDDQLELNKERLKILYGHKPTKKVSIHRTLPKKITKRRKHRSQVISKKIDISTNYYKMDNNVVDFLNPTQTLAEQTVYNRLYRLTVGYQKNTCRIGMGALAKLANIKSWQKTIKKALEGLVVKGHIKKFDTNNKGTLYQIFLPFEIKGVVKNTIVNSTIVKNTIVNSTISGVVKNTIGGSKKYYSKPNFSDDKKKPKDNLKTIYKDNNRDVVINFFNRRFNNHQKTLSIETVDELLKNHDLDKILTYINRIPNDSSIRNPAGLLCKALNNNWELSPTREEILKKTELDREKGHKDQQKRERIERIKFEKAKTEEEQFNKLFNSLPKGEQSKLRDKAVEKLRSEYSDVSPQIFDSVVATETMIMIKVRDMLEKEPKISKVEKKTGKEVEKTFGIPVKFGV